MNGVYCNRIPFHSNSVQMKTSDLSIDLIVGYFILSSDRGNISEDLFVGRISIIRCYSYWNVSNVLKLPPTMIAARVTCHSDCALV